MTQTPHQAPTVALAEGREHTRQDWEKLAAGVLRKSGRIAEGDADSLVWDKLTRRTLDGIAITPLGTPSLLDDLATSGRPDRVGEWEVSAHFADPDAAVTAADIKTDLDNGVTALYDLRP